MTNPKFTTQTPHHTGVCFRTIWTVADGQECAGLYAVCETGENIVADPSDIGDVICFTPDWNDAKRFANSLPREPYSEDLTEVGIQLVIPGAERVQPASVKQGELF